MDSVPVINLLLRKAHLIQGYAQCDRVQEHEYANQNNMEHHWPEVLMFFLNLEISVLDSQIFSHWSVSGRKMEKLFL